MTNLRLFTYLISALILLSSCKEYYSLEDYTNVPKIDAHIHYSYANPVLLEQAQKDNFRLITVNVETQSNPPIDVQEKVALQLVNDYPDWMAFLSTFGSNNWNTASWSDATINRIKASKDQGASGVKIWKTFGMQLQNQDSSFVFIDHAQLTPVFNYLEQNSIPLLAHIGEPKNCWLPLDEMTTENDRNYFANHPEFHMYLHPEMPSYEQIMNARDHVLARHTDMQVVGAHFGSMEWNLDTLAKRLDQYPNFAVDMAARIGHMHFHSDLDYEKTRSFFITYADRILYGTDMGVRSEEVTSGDGFHDYWYGDWKYLATDMVMQSRFINKDVKGLRLPKEALDKIYYANAVRWYSDVNVE